MFHKSCLDHQMPSSSLFLVQMFTWPCLASLRYLCLQCINVHSSAGKISALTY